MKFCILPESEMLQEAKAGHRQYLDLLLCLHEEFLLQQLPRKSATTKDLLNLRKECLNYAHTHFYQTFDAQKQSNFAAWLLECVEAVCSA